MSVIKDNWFETNEPSSSVVVGDARVVFYGNTFQAVLREPGRRWFLSLQGWRYWFLKRRFRSAVAIKLDPS